MEDEIIHIKKNHNFLENYGLLSKIKSLPARINSIINIIDNYPRLSEHKEKIKEIDEILQKLDVILSQLPFQIIQYINQMVQNNPKKSNFKKHLIDFNLRNYQEETSLLIDSIQANFQNIPTDKGGRKPSSEPHQVILALVSIFEEGTGKKATCGWDNYSDLPKGAFYEFVIDLVPILKNIGISLGTNLSIGTYCKKAIKTAKKLRILSEQPLPIPENIK
jgi:hypothetical protein